MSQERQENLAAFAVIEKRFRRWGLVSLFGLATFILCLILGAAFSPKGAWFVLMILGSWLALVGGIVVGDRMFRCPTCRTRLAGSKGDYCPECGAHALSREHWWSPHACAACGRVLRYGNKGGRLFKQRYCSHCGCHLHEQGV